MPQLSRRRLLAASVPALGGAAAALHSAVPHSHPWEHEAQARRATPARRAAAHARHGGHASFRDGRTVDHAANGFDPHAILRDFDWGTTTRLAERPRAARVGADRGRQGDRGRARREVRGLDLQRPHPRPDAALPRGRAAADHVRQRLDAPAHDPLPRHPPGRDGRRARARRRRDRAGRPAPSTSSTRSRPACTSTTATSARSPSTSPRASTARSSSTRRTGARTPTSS